MAICFITGIKHSGKSLLGSLAAKQLKARFIDSDDLLLPFSHTACTSVRQLYREIGKERFMQLEFKSIEQALSSDTHHEHGHLIMATGGGACDNGELVRLMKQRGTIVYLYREEAWLFKKIIASGIPPFLEGDDPKQAFHRLFLQRDARYRSIYDFMLQLIDSDSIEHNTALLVQLLASLL